MTTAHRPCRLKIKGTSDYNELLCAPQEFAAAGFRHRRTRHQRMKTPQAMGRISPQERYRLNPAPNRTCAEETAGSKIGVASSISPRGEIKAEMPVLAALAVQIRFSTARNRVIARC